MKISIKYVLLFSTALIISACKGESYKANVSASTPRGGVARFSGELVGDAVIAAQQSCQIQNMHAVPLAFFHDWQDDLGRENIMTFQCVE